MSSIAIEGKTLLVWCMIMQHVGCLLSPSPFSKTLPRYSNWSQERLPRSRWTDLTFIASSKRSFLTPGMPHTIIRASCVNKIGSFMLLRHAETVFVAMERLQNWEKLLERNFIPTPEFVYPTTYLYSFLNTQHSTWPLHSRIILASQESNGKFQ